jgi:hypothetical protein
MAAHAFSVTADDFTAALPKKGTHAWLSWAVEHDVIASSAAHRVASGLLTGSLACLA